MEAGEEMAQDTRPDLNEAKATFYQDSATVIGVAFTLVIAAVAIMFTNPSLESAAALYGLGVTALVLAVVLGLTIWKMLEYDRKRINAAREKK